MKWLLERLKEPSTHAALAAAFAIGINFVPPPWQAVAGLVGGLLGLTGAALPEQKAPSA